MFIAIFNIVAPVFILAGVGYTWVRLGFEYRIEFVTRFATSLAIPCLIFVSLMQAEINPNILGKFIGAVFMTYLLLGGLAFVFVKSFRLQPRTYLMPLISGNTGNLGLPLCLFAFGDLGLSYGILIFAGTSLVAFTVGIWVVAGGGSFKRLLQEPLVAATSLGLLFMWQGWHTPVFLTNALSLIGQMGIPMMLITLGFAISRLEVTEVLRAVFLSLSKIAMGVFSACFIIGLFDLDPMAASVLILQFSMPIAVTSYLLAEKYGSKAEALAGLVVTSTALTIAILPMVLYFIL